MSRQHQSRIISHGTSKPGVAVWSSPMQGASSARMKVLHPHHDDASPVDPTTCRGCGDLDPWSPYSRGLFYGKSNQGNEQFIRQTDIGALKEGKKKECVTCSLLLAGLGQFTETDLQDDTTVIKIIIAAEKSSRSLVAGPRKNDRVELYVKGGPPSPWPAIGPMEHVHPDSASDLGLSVVKDWVQNCLANHTDCCQAGPFQLPTRVLYVGVHNGNIRLYSSPGEKAHYLALSHCWGLNQPCKTTIANIEERKISIQFESLPKTYQDTITVARSLNVRFIWIDSLCIIQDNVSDWQRESASMSTVYKNALLTIAAARSADINGGCFAPRPPSVISQMMVLPSADNDGDDLKIFFRKPILTHSVFSYGFHDADASQFPLEDRAWCFQERILPTRIVHYTNEELVWECNGPNECECGVMQSGKQEPSLREYFRALLDEESPDRAEIWMELITKWSKRKLSFESDRLHTISGLAKSLQERGFGEYLAGLWKESLPRQLLWSASGRRTPSYRAPTWSFASVEATSILDCCDKIMPSEKTMHLQVLQASVVPAGEDPRGPVCDGSIRVSGPLQLGTVFWDYVNSNHGKSTKYYMHILGKRKDIHFDYPFINTDEDVVSKDRPFDSLQRDLDNMSLDRHGNDNNLETPEGLKVSLLAVCTENLRYKAHNQGWSVLWCLILRQSARVAGTLERVGILGLNQPDEPQKWLDEANMTTVTIV